MREFRRPIVCRSGRGRRHRRGRVAGQAVGEQAHVRCAAGIGVIAESHVAGAGPASVEPKATRSRLPRLGQSAPKRMTTSVSSSSASFSLQCQGPCGRSIRRASQPVNRGSFAALGNVDGERGLAIKLDGPRIDDVEAGACDGARRCGSARRPAGFAGWGRCRSGGRACAL